MCHSTLMKVREQLGSVLSLERVGLRNQTQVVRLGGGHLYPLGRLVYSILGQKQTVSSMRLKLKCM